jgi:hypothetical protein
LLSWPNALKAIIMASAVNNIHGPTDVKNCPIEYGIHDCRDGAGAVDAAMADIIAANGNAGSNECTGPCWWGVNTGTSSFNRYFYAAKGERIRVATSWWSEVDCPELSDCSYDRLASNFDLYIYKPSGGNPITLSTSFYNAYELVDFMAPETGRYRIYVQYKNGTETSNKMGIAWVKDATYLPDLRNSSGWGSQISIINRGARRRTFASLFPTAVTPVGGGYHQTPDGTSGFGKLSRAVGTDRQS